MVRSNALVLLATALALGTVLSLAGCATIVGQPISYLGDTTKVKNVEGKVTHIDFAGLGVGADSYANEYNTAVADAFANAPAGTQTLKSLKTFKAPSYWPQAAGLAAIILGSVMLTSSNTSLTGTALYVGGYTLELLNIYDFVVLGEPSPN